MALGSAIARYLEDSTIVEVMLNPNGRLRVYRLKDLRISKFDVKLFETCHDRALSPRRHFTR